MSQRALTGRGYRRAERVLSERDPVMGRIIAAHGRCGLARAQREDPFIAMVEAIVWQQLSGKAAATIYSRVLDLLPDRVLTPATLLTVPRTTLRQAGLSNAKVAYVCDLATQVAEGTVHLDVLDTMDDEAVIEELTKVKGIGRWTAEMFLMFRLHRPDVFPIDDLGIVNAIVRAYRLRKRPAPPRLHKIAEPWRPYRSVACWYLWASLDTVTPGKKKR